MASDKKIKAVLFDLGDTLINYGDVNVNQLFCNAAKLSYEFLKSCGQPVGNFKSYSRRNLVAIRFRYVLSALTGNDFDSLTLLKKINSKKGIELSDQQWQQLEWCWYEPLEKLSHIEPDIIETLQRLTDSGLKLGIVSNTFVNAISLEKHLEMIGILDLFSILLFSYNYNFRKPDIRLFKIAAEKIGCAPENIMFVGDRIDKDIKPAIKVSMTAVLKTAHTNHGRKLPKKALRVDRIAELPGLIEKINAQAATN